MLNKRMVDRYEVTDAIKLGDKEIIIGINTKNLDLPYMVCNCIWDKHFCIERYKEAFVSNDYLEIMSEFLNRLEKQMLKVQEERNTRKLPLESLSMEHCIPNSNDENFENRIIVLKKSTLQPEYQTADYQLYFAFGGTGCIPAVSTGKVHCRNIFSGQDMIWQRHQILGIVRPECIPEWAKDINNLQLKDNAKQKPDKGIER